MSFSSSLLVADVSIDAEIPKAAKPITWKKKKVFLIKRHDLPDEIITRSEIKVFILKPIPV